MAVVLGTNAGFVSEAPVADPSGSNFVADFSCTAVRHTAPGGMTKITEVGWWCDNATEAANFEVGLYTNDVANSLPETLLFSDKVNAKGTGTGWKTVAVDWDITPGTIYWIAVQLDDTATSTNFNYTAGGYYTNDSSEATLFDPTWPNTSPGGEFTFAIYALVEAGATYSELSGTIAVQSVVSGNIDTTAVYTLSGTIAAQSSVSGNLGSTTVGIDVQTSFIKRLVVVGRNRLYYEDI